MTKYKAFYLPKPKMWAIKKRKFGFWFTIYEDFGAIWDEPSIKMYDSLVLALQQISKYEEEEKLRKSEASRRLMRNTLLVDFCDPLVGRVIKYDKFKTWK